MLTVENVLQGEKKTYFRFPGIVSNNGEEGLTLPKKRRDKWLACISREVLIEDKLRYARICSDHFVSGKKQQFRDIPNNICS